MSERIRPSGPDAWSDAVAAILEPTTPAAESADGHGPPNILYTIGHHPDLLPAFLGFTSTLALRGVLARRDSELLAMRASWNCRSAFEWGHHVEYGLAEGFSETDVERVAAGPSAAGWSAHDRTRLEAADELQASQDYSDRIYNELRSRYSDAQIVEITFVVGNYTMLSMVANATRVPIEARLPAMPTAAALE
jgi:4-carboxymuconolactone decarboxylase